MLAGRVRELNDIALLPTVGCGVERGDRYIRTLDLAFASIQLQSLIALPNHGWVGLPICGEPHHQLRHTQGQALVLIGMPCMPRLAIRMGQPGHQRVFGACRDVGCAQLPG